MTSEQFCLKWNNYQSNIVSALGNLKLDEDFVDVTLSCEGRTIKAHKVILSACSLYFRDVFRETPCNHPIIILKDTQYADLESLVKYVYQGQVYISQENLSSFLKTADALQIKGLAEQSQPPGSADSSPNSSPDHAHNASPVPEVKQQQQQQPLVHPSPPSSSFPAPPVSPVHSSPSSYPSQSNSGPTTAPLLPRASPIKIPTLSHLKRSSFSNLAQYLSGSRGISSPPLNNEDHASPSPGGISNSKKRKLTPPTKRYELPNYSGSTSTASPGSPPHSHSTEGGEASLEMGEESDRDSSRSIESNDLAKPPQLLSDLETKDPHLHRSLTHHSPYHHHHHLNQPNMHNHLHHPGIPQRLHQNSLLSSSSSEKKEEDFGETLDLSKNSSRHPQSATTPTANTTTTHLSPTYPNNNSVNSNLANNNNIPNVPTHISGGVLEAALTASDPMSSSRGGSLGCMSPAKRLAGISTSAASNLSNANNTNTTTLSPTKGSGNPSQNKEKDGQGRNSLVSGQCPHCGNEYTNFSSLKYHVRLIHSEASNTLCCYLCPSSFIGRATYKEHLISIHGVKHQ